MSFASHVSLRCFYIVMIAVGFFFFLHSFLDQILTNHQTQTEFRINHLFNLQMQRGSESKKKKLEEIEEEKKKTMQKTHIRLEYTSNLC